jgi:hypothetical protein
MLDEQGRIGFASELMDAVDAFLDAYEEREGRASGDLERGLVISYILGVMRCDLEALWDCLGDAEVFGALHPRAVFEACGCDEPAAAERKAEIQTELRERGWLALRERA